MIKFNDDELKNKEKNELFAKFIKALRKVDFIDDKGSVNIGKIAKDRNWPKTLDIENFEIDSIMADALVGNAGGDWQMATWFTVYYNKRKDKVDLIMFEDGSNGTGKKQSFSKVKKEIQKILSGEISENDDDDKSEKSKDKDDASSHFFSEEELRKIGREYIEKLEKEELDESKSVDTRTLKKYFDLSSAFGEAQDQDTLKMINNFTTISTDEPIEINDELTLDLNGFEIDKSIVENAAEYFPEAKAILDAPPA